MHRALSLASLLAACALALVGCGGSGNRSAGSTATSTATGSTAPGHPRGAGAAVHLSAAVVAHLPHAVSGEAVLSAPGEVLVLGGLSSLDESTAAIIALRSGQGTAREVGALSEPKHDLAAALLGARRLILGGGSSTELDSVEELTPTLSTETIGALPSPRSDLAAVTVGPDVYVLGGYDGAAPVPEVLRTSDGRHFSTAGTLALAVRYPAAAVLGSTIYLFGGELADGSDTDAIQAFDTLSGRGRIVGKLPLAISHACAIAIGARAYVLGGRSREAALRRIMEYVPSAGVRSAGSLPFAVTNAAAVQAGEGGPGYLVGGLGVDGSTLDTVIALRH